VSLQPKLWMKKQEVVKISAPTNHSLGWNTPLLYMDNTRQRIELESSALNRERLVV